MQDSLTWKKIDSLPYNKDLIQTIKQITLKKGDVFSINQDGNYAIFPSEGNVEIKVEENLSHFLISNVSKNHRIQLTFPDWKGFRHIDVMQPGESNSFRKLSDGSFSDSNREIYLHGKGLEHLIK